MGQFPSTINRKLDLVFLFLTFVSLWTYALTFIYFFIKLGRKFDKNGDIVKEWWSNSSLMEFNKRAECIEEQYSKYKVQGKYPVSSFILLTPTTPMLAVLSPLTFVVT